MGISIHQARAHTAFFLRVLVFGVLMIAAAGGNDHILAPVKAGGAVSPFEPGSSIASQPVSSPPIYPQTTPTSFPDQIRYAIIAHALECIDEEGGIRFTLSGNMMISGGGVFSNACLETAGGANNVIEIIDGSIYFVTEWMNHGDPMILPMPIPFPNPIDISFLGVPAPDCSFLPMFGDHAGGGVIYPGVYGSITLTSGTLKMLPGLYCVLGDVSILGGMVAAYGVTLYVEGDFTSTSSAVVRLHAPQKRVAPQMGIMDVLLYLGEGSRATLFNKGYAGFTGVVYAPGDSTEVVLSGFGTINSQVIAHTVRVATADNINLALDPLHSYPKEALDE